MVLALAQTCLVGGVGCGTVLHPERRGQPAGPLDWKIVAFDAAGLLLFFVPGVIAFAVDFNNGTIYLPPEHSNVQSEFSGLKQLISVHVPDKQMTVGKVEAIVSLHTDQDVRLTPGSYQTQELASIDEFWTTNEKFQEQWQTTGA